MEKHQDRTAKLTLVVSNSPEPALAFDREKYIEDAIVKLDDLIEERLISIISNLAVFVRKSEIGSGTDQLEFATVWVMRIASELLIRLGEKEIALLKIKELAEHLENCEAEAADGGAQ